MAVGLLGIYQNLGIIFTEAVSQLDASICELWKVTHFFLSQASPTFKGDALQKLVIGVFQLENVAIYILFKPSDSVTGISSKLE